MDTYFEKPRFARLSKDGQAQRVLQEEMGKGQTESDWRFPLDLFVILAMPVMAILSAFVLPIVVSIRQGNPVPFYLSLAFSAVGVVLLFVAKLPLYREKRFFTFGARSLSGRHRRLYVIAYRFIGVSIVAMLLLIAVASA